jgi:hypothetical protein
MQRELSLTALTVDQACKAMLDFYRLHRAEGCDVSADGDMLLVQWDVVDSEEQGRCLEWNLTRQFILAETSDDECDDADDDEEESDDDDSSDDEPIWQLSLTMRFPLKDSAEDLAAGNKWCPTPRPQAVDYFEKFTRESPAFQLAATLTAGSVELDFFNAE